MSESQRESKVVLLSTYEMGRQPFGLASPAAWLEGAAAELTVKDLSLDSLDDEILTEADLVAFYLPMHTATRLAAPLIERTRRLNPRAEIAAFGIYAPLNETYLRGLGTDHVLGGEFEPELLSLVDREAEPDVSSHTRFRVPVRVGLPALTSYARLRFPDGEMKTVGYTEASRGCKHSCKHCPVVPVYQGRFNIVRPEVVLEDIANQVEAGAEHITFGDPDFFNGPAHAVRVVEGMREHFPELTYDATIKVEHLVQRFDLIRWLADTGCAFVTTAVESFDDEMLGILDKGHNAADFESVLGEARRVGLAISPTFLAFTPWTTLESYGAFLSEIARLDLVPAVAPIQYAIRLLLPEGSLLLDQPDVEELVGPFDAESLAYPWAHPDPRVDRLQEAVLAVVSHGHEQDRREMFDEVVGDGDRAWCGDEPTCHPGRRGAEPGNHSVSHRALVLLS